MIGRRRNLDRPRAKALRCHANDRSWQCQLLREERKNLLVGSFSRFETLCRPSSLHKESACQGIRPGIYFGKPVRVERPHPFIIAGRATMSVHISETRVVKGACPQDCPDTCAFMYHVEDGKLVEVTGDPDHPMTRGGLCVKLKNFAEHHYNPDRLLYPMKRVGPKGSGQFKRISWDEALAEIKTRWTEIIAQYGSQAILPHAYLGHQGTLNGLTSGDAFFNRLGASVAEKTYCESGSSTAWIMTVGQTGGLAHPNQTRHRWGLGSRHDERDHRGESRR